MTNLVHFVHVWEFFSQVSISMSTPQQSRGGVSMALIAATRILGMTADAESKGVPAELVLRLRVACVWLVGNVIASNARALLEREERLGEREQLIDLIHDIDLTTTRAMNLPGVAAACSEASVAPNLTFRAPNLPLVAGGSA